MTIIGVISDTHIQLSGRRQLPSQVFEAFADCDLILHAGDLNTLRTVHDLEALAPVFAVYGNNDNREALAALPASRRMEVEDCVIGLTRGDEPPRGQRMPRPLDDAPGNKQTAANALSHFAQNDDVVCVVFGHSHRPLIKKYEFVSREILLVNPGSATDRRREPLHSCGLLRVDGAHIEAELISW